MKRLNTLRLFALLSMVVGQVFANSYDCCGPLEAGRWYVMPKVGAAPGIFTNRGHERRVVPSAGFNQPINCPMTFSDSIVDCATVLPNPENIFQENCCPGPKFSDLFTNGVLHVGGEIGYVTDCHCLYFIDLIYNRASGSCLPTETKNVKALDGCCPDDCNSNCDSPLSTSERTDQFENYSAFGAYVGNRYYFDRMWCDRASFFLGLKVGILHRNNVSVCSTIPAEKSGDVTIFAERTLSNIAICKSNSVSGGVQIGLDYCINDCLAFVVGFEVLASCPFKVNRNIPLAIPDPEPNTVPSSLAFPFPTNLVGSSTGTFLQFPIWAGLRWEWDMCCDPCN